MKTDAHALAPRQLKRLLAVLLLLMPLFGMAVDLVAPSLPAMAAMLGESNGAIQNLISLYLLGYALGNFVSGFLTDAWGRRKLLLGGMAGFALISLLPLWLPTLPALLATRFVQGLMVGTISVVARSVYPDVLAPQELVRVGVIAGSMFGLGPIIGPVLGGYLQVYAGWQACFVFFSASMVLMWALVACYVPETHFNRHPLNLPTIRRNLAEVLRHRHFMGMVVLMGAIYSMSIAFNTVGPFIIQTGWHYSPIVFGHIAFGLGLVFLLATFLCRYLLTRHPVAGVQQGMTRLLLAVTLAGLALSQHWPDSLALLCAISALMFFGQGMLFPMSMGRGLSLFRHIAGTATAVMYLINILMTSVTSFLLSLLSVHDAPALLAVYLILALICFFANRWLIQPAERAQASARA
ncbi:Bcr/CflA family efflux MFS transporter [Chromobacterium paludis]|uniref:Bcr/CflA family efflux transporter n=1 Tax=Chromobacterium paludis TaxID=2605945 RepID=A0A5C1DF78_9NEIS|nr:Bcr/CflA family efflux MFS transporter [Chromobacterium paludis]QEL55173.1 multidrug effflux MFS transporter [Chromobacterium paludis]